MRHTNSKPFRVVLGLWMTVITATLVGCDGGPMRPSRFRTDAPPADRIGAFEDRPVSPAPVPVISPEYAVRTN
jgi:hypothetical protein